MKAARMHFCAIALLAGSAWSLSAQSAAQSAYDDFLRKAREDYVSFRDKANQQYAEFLADPWHEMESKREAVKPKDPKPPVIEPFDKTKPAPDPKPVVIDEVIAPPPPPKPQPKPIEPIKPVEPPVKSKPVTPQLDPVSPPDVTINPRPIDHQPVSPQIVPDVCEFEIYDTPMEVRWDDSLKFRLPGISETDIANAWKTLSSKQYDATVYDLLQLRDKHKLDDWGYLQTIKAFTDKVLGADSNESTMLMAYIYCTSGYKMRFASTGNTLVMLFASDHRLYAPFCYFTIDDTKFYPLGVDEPIGMRVSNAKFPNEQPMSLAITHVPDLTVNATEPRVIKSKAFPSMEISVPTDATLMKYYDNYPSSEVGGNLMTRWAMYAHTPLSETARNALYPQLRERLNNLSEYEAVSRILNWIQTGMVYEYDDKVWGADRAFFPEETLYYPYCDCEDRSILFTRLVKDILGLDAILVFYPGHLAAAVNFNSDVRGDYITTGGKRYVVCDPTYIGAPVGRTMPSMDNASAKVIAVD